MKIYELVKQDDGSVKIESTLEPEEMKIALTVGLNFLLSKGLMPVSMIKYMEEHPEEGQLDFLEQVDKDKIGQA